MGDEADAEYVYDQMTVYLCPSWALSLGYMGVAAGAVLSNWGSAVSYRIKLGKRVSGVDIIFIWYLLLGCGLYTV